MQEFLDKLTIVLTDFSSFIWDYMLYVLLAIGLVLTFRTGFIQFLKFGEGLKLVFGGFFSGIGNLFKGKKAEKKGDGDVSPLTALATALASTVGNGNIGGVATALVMGGPGAIFWMWVCGFVGMATKYAEALLAVHFREKYADGKIAGGPMYYIMNGFTNKSFAKILAYVFAVGGVLATLFGTGLMMQSNQMTLALRTQLGLGEFLGITPQVYIGVIITLLTGMVIIGGIKRIGSVADKIVPTMIIVFLGSGITIIIMNIQHLPEAFGLIFSSAFSPSAALGGFAGASVKMAMQMGFRRGLLSNEAGLGSAPIAHAAAQTPSPVHQGLIGTMEVFIDTILVCTMTALINLSSGIWTTGVNGTEMTALAFSHNIGFAGGLIVAFSSFLFGYSTLLGWYYYGEQCFRYLFKNATTLPYKIVYVTLVFVGAIVSIDIVFIVGDIANAFMALPNIIALFVLSGVVAKITKEFFTKYKSLAEFELANKK